MEPCCCYHSDPVPSSYRYSIVTVETLHCHRTTAALPRKSHTVRAPGTVATIVPYQFVVSDVCGRSLSPSGFWSSVTAARHAHYAVPQSQRTATTLDWCDGGVAVNDVNLW